MLQPFQTHVVGLEITERLSVHRRDVKFMISTDDFKESLAQQKSRYQYEDSQTPGLKLKTWFSRSFTEMVKLNANPYLGVKRPADTLCVLIGVSRRKKMLGMVSLNAHEKTLKIKYVCLRTILDETQRRLKEQAEQLKVRARLVSRFFRV